MKTEIPTNQLTEDEVLQRLEDCKGKPEIIDEVYSFGQSLMKVTLEDIQRIDLKAASLAAYCGAIITLIVSTQGIWTKAVNPWTYLLIVASTFFALTAAIFCVYGLRLQRFEWISQKEWLESSCFDSLDKLKRYRILTIWGTIKSHRDVHRNKVIQVRKAQSFLVAAAISLFLALVAGLWYYNLNHGFWSATWH